MASLACGASPDAAIPVGHVGVSLPFPLEQFLAPDPLAVAAVANLHPSGLPFGQVGRILVLGHDALKIVFAGKPE
jgi:hypothetical protein